MTERKRHIKNLEPAVESDTAMPIRVTKTWQTAYSILHGESVLDGDTVLHADAPAGMIQLSGTSQGTSGMTGSLTVLRPLRVLVPLRELSPVELVAIGWLGECIRDAAMEDYGATATEALVVTFIVLTVLLGMRRLPYLG